MFNFDLDLFFSGREIAAIGFKMNILQATATNNMFTLDEYEKKHV